MNIQKRIMPFLLGIAVSIQCLPLHSLSVQENDSSASLSLTNLSPHERESALKKLEALKKDPRYEGASKRKYFWQQTKAWRYLTPALAAVAIAGLAYGGLKGSKGDSNQFPGSVQSVSPQPLFNQPSSPQEPPADPTPSQEPPTEPTPSQEPPTEPTPSQESHAQRTHKVPPSFTSPGKSGSKKKRVKRQKNMISSQDAKEFNNANIELNRFIEAYEKASPQYQGMVEEARFLVNSNDLEKKRAFVNTYKEKLKLINDNIALEKEVKNENDKLQEFVIKYKDVSDFSTYVEAADLLKDSGSLSEKRAFLSQIEQLEKQKLAEKKAKDTVEKKLSNFINKRQSLPVWNALVKQAEALLASSSLVDKQAFWTQLPSQIKQIEANQRQEEEKKAQEEVAKKKEFYDKIAPLLANAEKALKEITIIVLPPSSSPKKLTPAKKTKSQKNASDPAKNEKKEVMDKQRENLSSIKKELEELFNQKAIEELTSIKRSQALTEVHMNLIAAMSALEEKAQRHIKYYHVLSEAKPEGITELLKKIVEEEKKLSQK